MIAITQTLTIPTKGKGTYEITDKIATLVNTSGIKTGIASVFIQHTSASLIIYENADPTARADLHHFLQKLIPDNAPGYHHTAEGPDDTTSHLRMALTRTSETIPIAHSHLQLGTWQGIFLFEHRHAPHQRTLTITLLGTEK